KRTRTKTHVLMSSSTQEERKNLYGKSKKEGRELFADWAKETRNIFTGFIIPNVFGPFGHPYYNSVVATFCHQLTHNEIPEIDNDSTINLIYVGELVEEILKSIQNKTNNAEYKIDYTATKKVSELLQQLNDYKTYYLEKGEIPGLLSVFDVQLFNTFRSYIDHKTYFPRKFIQHSDNRGSFVEIIR